MKRSVFKKGGFLAVAAAVSALLAISAAAEMTTKDACTAYYEFLLEEQDAVGRGLPNPADNPNNIAGVDPNSWVNEKIDYAALIDFNQDGVPELLFAKSVYTPQNWLSSTGQNYIYTFDGTNMVLLEKGAFVFERGFGPNYTMNLRVSRDANGTSYLVKGGSPGGIFPESYSFETVENGQIVSKSKMYQWFEPDIYISNQVYTKTGTLHYYLGGVTTLDTNASEVTRDRYFAEKNKYFAGGEQTYTYDPNQPFDLSPILGTLQAYVDPETVYYWKNPSDWAIATVNDAIAQGLVPWTLQKKYNQPITRGEFCALAVNQYERMTQTKLTELKYFYDTYDENVEKIAAIGVIRGKSEGYVNPDDLLTREEAATILVRLADAMQLNLPAANADYTDLWVVSDWARDAVGRLQAAGIMSGTGNGMFSPTEPYTREQSITTIMRLADSSVPVETLKVTAEKSVVRATETVQLHLELLPANATDKGITYTVTADKPGYGNSTPVNVDANGLVSTYYEGKVTITATASNGVSGSCELEILPESTIFLDSPAPITLNTLYLEKYEHVEDSIDFVPKNPFVAGKVTVTKAAFKEQTSKYATPQIEVTIRLDSIEPLVGGTALHPYVKYRLKDASGKEIKSGVISKTGDMKVGEEYTATIYPGLVNYGDTYTMEFIEEKGIDSSEILASAPTIELPKLPFCFTQSGKRRFRDTDGLYKTKELTTSGRVTDVKVGSMSYDPSNQVFNTELTIMHRGDDLPDQANMYYYIRLTDSTGKVTSLGTQYIRSNDSEIVTVSAAKLKPNEVYTLSLEAGN